MATTVDDLTQWLSVVEVGLTSLLEMANEDIIEEEQESEVLSSGVNPGNGFVSTGQNGVLVNGAGHGGAHRTGVGGEYGALEKDGMSIVTH